ncbi:Scarecrow-like protein 32 [Ananas comosus]|uniref:Scarecrow-like protein 32 n=1 Tax=Ananas comosus TaxID=4615 RepID=A0A199VIR2_ANACO|nr:Scarecrow-like protein 32 [Ananas comosus]
MMQFTQSAPPPAPLLHHNGGGHGLGLDLAEPDQPLLYSQRCAVRPPWTGRSAVAFPTSSRALGSFNTAGCMEQLLVHCANAIDGNDATLAQQILWVLNNIAPPDGDSNQRLTSAFLRALFSASTSPASSTSPWHRFGYTASNAAILDAVEGSSVVHIVDLGTTHCMQIPTLIDALASRPEGPPVLRLTVPSATVNSPPPMLDISYDELGSRLVNFARSRNIPMEFQVVHSSPSDGFSALIDQLRVQS